MAKNDDDLENGKQVLNEIRQYAQRWTNRDPNCPAAVAARKLAFKLEHELDKNGHDGRGNPNGGGNGVVVR